MLREDKVGKGDKGYTIIKITSFVNHKPKESIIKSNNIIEELKTKEKKKEELAQIKEEPPQIKEEPLQILEPGPEESKHPDEDSQKDMSEGEEQGEAEQEEMIQQEEEEEPAISSDAVNVGDYIFMINQGKYASVKSCIEDTLFECVIINKKEEDVQMLML